MSSATPSRPTSAVPLLASCIERFVAGVRAVAFWTAALLPIAVLASLATGAASRHPSVLAGALTLNAVCAIIGHEHSPN
jgi:hypothetical protein